MYTTGGLLHDPNRRDSILRAKRRKRERLAARCIMGFAGMAVLVALLMATYGALWGDSGTVRVAIGVIGAGAFLFGLAFIGLRASLNIE